jgi:anti-anti-sigma factor
MATIVSMSAKPRNVPFSMEEHLDGERCVVRLNGELDLAGAPALELMLREATRRHSDVVLDLDGLTFVDSTGIRAILAAHRSCAQDGTRLVALGGGREVIRVLEMCGLRDVPPFGDEREA